MTEMTRGKLQAVIDEVLLKVPLPDDQATRLREYAGYATMVGRGSFTRCPIGLLFGPPANARDPLAEWGYKFDEVTADHFGLRGIDEFVVVA